MPKQPKRNQTPIKNNSSKGSEMTPARTALGIPELVEIIAQLLDAKS
jgi:hypothetical protein